VNKIGYPVKIFPIKKRIKTELFIDIMAGLCCVKSQIRGKTILEGFLTTFATRLLE